MTTRTIPARDVSTRDRLVQLEGERRRSRKVCEVRRDGDQVTLVLSSPAGLSRATHRQDDPVEVTA